MQKDVIYIDTEDDITAIIGKVKAAGSKIVALVPPKRTGALQSAVNLKLLQRAAGDSQKRIVLITNDRPLVALAAGLSMPVAKNLQSKPEIPQVTGPQIAEEEVIDGESLPIGEFAAAAATKKEQSVADAISEKVEISKDNTAPAAPPVTGAKLAAPKKKSLVPDFASFRTRLFLIGGGAVVLVVFLVWAIAIAPHASITITAKTQALNFDRTLALNPAMEASDPAKLQLKSIVQQVKKSVAIEFDATGSKDIGNKATGTIQVRNCDIGSDFILPQGTKFTGAGGQVFASTQAVTIPEFSGPASSCTQGGSHSGKADVPVQATALGPEYNVTAQAYSVVNYSNEVDGVGGEMSGGTRETVKVVSQEDVDKAKAQLPQVDEPAAKMELHKLFTNDHIVIEESYELSNAAEVVTPAVGEQAARGKITKETTLTLAGLARADVKTILETAVNEALKDKPGQQAYHYGEQNITFQTYQKGENNTANSRMVTSASIGPKIDTAALAEQITGKRFGDIQAIITDIPGVEKADIQLSPFWVTTAPSVNKIDIDFTVSDEE